MGARILLLFAMTMTHAQPTAALLVLVACSRKLIAMTEMPVPLILAIRLTAASALIGFATITMLVHRIHAARKLVAFIPTSLATIRTLAPTTLATPLPVVYTPLLPATITTNVHRILAYPPLDVNTLRLAATIMMPALTILAPQLVAVLTPLKLAMITTLAPWIPAIRFRVVYLRRKFAWMVTLAQAIAVTQRPPMDVNIQL